MVMPGNDSGSALEPGISNFKLSLDINIYFIKNRAIPSVDSEK